MFKFEDLAEMQLNTVWVNGLIKAFGYDPTLCKCGTQMVLNYELSDFKRGFG